ncbi:MAG: DNA-methyltransferase [Sedimentisphaeraceae bacterium JB056]
MKYQENTIIHGNCIETFGSMEPFADLVFADPPFNIGYEYDKYHDKIGKEAYLEWTKDWMSACCGILKPNGSFYIAIGDDYAANVKVIADELGLNMRNWIIWHYTFGQQTKAKFARSHTHIFYFTKDTDNFTFNDNAVRVPSDRQLIYNDKRANNAGKLPDDTWNEFSRVCGTFKEREGWHPCQMPEVLLARIIASSSNPGDIVVDPFMGSGTTAATALKLGRKYFGTDISENYVENIGKRLEKIKKQIAAPTGCQLNYTELFELQRYCIEIKHAPSDIISKQQLISLTVKMFSNRIAGDRNFTEEQILQALRLIEQNGLSEYICIKPLKKQKKTKKKDPKGLFQ